MAAAKNMQPTPPTEPRHRPLEQELIDDAYWQRHIRQRRLIRVPEHILRLSLPRRQQLYTLEPIEPSVVVRRFRRLRRKRKEKTTSQSFSLGAYKMPLEWSESISLFPHSALDWGPTGKLPRPRRHRSKVVGKSFDSTPKTRAQETPLELSRISMERIPQVPMIYIGATLPEASPNFVTLPRTEAWYEQGNCRRHREDGKSGFCPLVPPRAAPAQIRLKS